jgi:uncharacterized protein YndB with AHSA1/START domain
MSNATTITANPGEQVIDIERVLDAPIANVYRAYTDPALFAQWVGPRGYTMDLTSFDVWDGGTWAYIHRTPDRGDHGFHGVFHSVRPLERIVQTFEYEGVPGHVSLEAVSFDDLGDNTTRVRVHTVFQSIEDRDGMVASGMAMGVTQGFEQLDELLAEV